MNRSGPERSRAGSGGRIVPRAFVCAGLAAAVIAIYWPVLGYDFVSYDDAAYVANNAQVRAGLTLSGALWALGATQLSNWHPLTWLSLMLDAEIAGADPRVYHATNLLLHLASSLLLFLLLDRATARRWRSAVVALLFAVHPLHVESVAWIAERKDVLSALFWMLTTLAYLRYVEWPSAGRWMTVVVSFALGLMAKPMLVSLPIVLLLMDYWPLGRLASAGAGTRKGKTLFTDTDDDAPLHADQLTQGDVSATETGHVPRLRGAGRSRSAPAAFVDGEPKSYAVVAETEEPGRLRLARALWEKSPLFALAAASCVVTLLAQMRGDAVMPLESLTPGARIANALVAYTRYIGKMLWPAGLAVFYPLPRDGWPLWRVLASGALLASITVLVLLVRRTRGYMRVGWLWYLVTLLPVIGLVQVGDQAMADRYAYIPIVGLFLMVVWGFADLFATIPGSQRPALGAADGILQGRPWIAAAGIFRGSWNTAAGIFRERPWIAAAAAFLAIAALAVSAGKQVRYWRGSVPLYEHAIEVTGENAVAHNNLGAVLTGENQVEEAAAHFREAIRINPDYAESHCNLALALMRGRRYDGAIAESHETLRRWPTNDRARAQLGLALALVGRREEAMLNLREALRLNPGNLEAHINLGVLLADRGDAEEALRHALEAVRIDPSSADAHRLLERLQHRGRIGALQAVPDHVVSSPG